MDDKAVIEAVRAAYDALDDTQKALVDADTLKKLTDAEDALEVAEVIATITALKAADAVTTADKTDIEAARAAYEALTADQKTAVGIDALAKLVACEVALAIAELPTADSVTTANKDAIEAARAAYDALNDAQKTAVGTDALAKLEACEVLLVNKMIEALPAATDVTTANEDAIEAARAAYNALTDNQKSKVSADTLKKLTDAEAALKEATDTAAANTVSEKINALPAAANVKTSNKEAIEAARAAYNALTDDQKSKVSAETLKKLTDAETALAAVTVSDTIDNLPSANDVATDHKDAIEKARAAFDALSAEQKEQVSTDTLSKLKVCELALAIAELPEANTVTTNDKPAIEAVRESFKNLTPEQQAKVPTAVLAKLQACELVITIGELPEANAVTTANKKTIEDARSAYNSLNDEQKNKISADALLKLELAEIALAIAELPDADKVTGTDKATIEAASANYKKLTNEQRTKIGDVAATKLEAVEAALKIAELPEENAVTTTNKEAIEVAREAYDKLSDAQKSQVGETFKSKLEANEVALAKKLIEAIPDPGEITTGDTEKVVAAKTAYDKLSDAQKENISEAEKDKIAAAEQAIKDTAAAQTAIDKLNALPAAADITAANRDTIVAARAAYDALSDEQKAKVTADTLNKLTAAEVKLAQIAMSEVSAKSDSDVVFTGNSIQLINTPTTALSEGHRIVYAVTTENEAPADSIYTTDIPIGEGAGTYHVWYKVVDAENHDVTTPSHVAVIIEKGNSSSSGSQANTSSEESGLIYSGHAQKLVTAGTAEGGTMVYALGEDGDHAPANEKFTEEIPKGTEAKTYYVWYKVKGDANHSDTTPVCIPVTITAVDVKADTMIVSDGKDTSVGTEKPQVSDGLKEQAVSLATSSNKKVVLNLIITPQGQDEVSDSAYIKSDEQMHSKIKDQYKDEGLVSVDVLDIYIEKFVDENQEANVTKTDKVIEIGMTYDFTGKYDVVVVRDHEGSAQNFTALSSRPAAADYRDATFFADVPNNKLYIYSNLFSKYVVAYSTVEGNARPAAVASSSSSSSSEPTTVPVYRLFNKLTGTHFYTANKVERDLLLEQNANAGWIDEGIAFQTAVTSSTPVYRVFDVTKGIHLYTADIAARDAYIASGCADEGIAWYAAVSVGRKVYKVSNPKNGYVLYTTSKAEADGLANVGFTSQEAEFVVY
ncbi:MAG: hypothetical protein IJR96_10960 [Pseudobutyrivibrio sp.]|nr:hypothetical protein [Pseudobutyrivibrio sp.]